MVDLILTLDILYYEAQLWVSMDSSTRRYGGLVAIPGGYAAILGYGSVTGTATAALTNLFLGTVLLGVATAGYIRNGTLEAGVPEMGAFVVAGIAMAYEGVSRFSDIPPIEYIYTVGEIAVLVAGSLLLYRVVTASRRSAVDD